MAVRIPRYEQQTLPQGQLQVSANPAQTIAAVNKLPNAVGEGMQRLGASIGDVGAAFLAVDDNEAAARTAKNIFESQERWRTDMVTRQNSAEPGAPGFAKSFSDDYKKWAEESIANEPNKRGKELLRNGLYGLGVSLNNEAIHFQKRASDAKIESDLDTAYEVAAKTVYADPKQTDNARATLLASIANMDIDPVQKLALAKKYGERLDEAAASGDINNDAAGALGKLKGAPRAAPGFAGAVGFTLRHEGGLNPSDSNGSASNFGINQAANPGVDVKSLTKEGATEIYRTKYWGAINGDALAAKNPQLALVVFDTAVMAGPGKAKEMLAKADGDPIKFMEMREQFLAGLLKSNPEKYGKYANAWAERNRDLRNNLLPDGAPPVSGTSYIDRLPIDRRMVLEGMATTRVNQNQAIFRQDIERRTGDALSMAQDGIVDPRPITQQEFVSAYGEAEGVRQHGLYMGNQTMAADINNMRSMPTEEISAFLAAHAPKAGAGYEVESKRYGLMQQAAQRVVKMREDDPATYVLSSSQPVGESYRKMQSVLENPQASNEARTQAAQAYAAASIAEQRRLGVGEPRLLSKADSDSVAQKFAGSVAGEPMAQHVQALSAMWGNYWPTVYKQLIADKALPPAAVVIGSGMTGSAAADMAMASKFKDEELLVGLADPKAAKKDTGEYVTKALEEFRSTMVGADGNQRTVGGVDTYNLFHAQTEKLALYYVGQGMSEKDAAKKAANATILGRYDFVNQYGPYRVPKTENVGKVTDGAHYAIQTIKPDDIAMPETLRKDSFVRSDVVKSIKRKGYWVTAPDESGLVLFHGDTRAPILRADGQPFQYTWQQLSSMDDDGRIPAAVDPMGNVTGVR